MGIGALRVCLECGAVYTPNVLPGGRLPRDYKHCPQCGSTNTALPGELESRSKNKRRVVVLGQRSPHLTGTEEFNTQGKS